MKKPNRFPASVAEVFGILSKQGERLRSDLAAGRAEVEQKNIIPVDGLLACLQEKDGELTIALKVVIHISSKKTDQLNAFARTLLKSNLYNSYFLVKEINKYHVVMCSKLQEMFDKKRQHRFHLSHRYDGLFSYSYVDRAGNIKKDDQKLHICKFCLAQISKYTKEKHNYRKFIPDNFFNHPNSPKGLDIEEESFSSADAQTQTPKYSKNWSKIANFVKKRKNYTCEECGIRLIGKRVRYLHCHHENANIEDNLLYNLKCLCIKCHAQQYQHGHMKALRSYKNYMKLLENGKL